MVLVLWGILLAFKESWYVLFFIDTFDEVCLASYWEMGSINILEVLIKSKDLIIGLASGLHISLESPCLVNYIHFDCLESMTTISPWECLEWVECLVLPLDWTFSWNRLNRKLWMIYACGLRSEICSRLIWISEVPSASLSLLNTLCLHSVEHIFQIGFLGCCCRVVRLWKWRIGRPTLCLFLKSRTFGGVVSLLNSVGIDLESARLSVRVYLGCSLSTALLLGLLIFRHCKSLFFSKSHL